MGEEGQSQKVIYLALRGELKLFIHKQIFLSKSAVFKLYKYATANINCGHEL